MKSILTHTCTKYAALLAAAGSLAATCGHTGWSDANLKDEIEPLEDALSKLRSIRTA
jgi:hypothetical protein